MNLSIHQQLADLLGIEWRGQRVTGFEVRCHVGEVPEVIVYHMLAKKEGFDVDVQRFELVGRDDGARPFDLDRMCDEANARVRRLVERRTAEALHALGLH